jgi:hypothetical protein
MNIAESIHQFREAAIKKGDGVTGKKDAVLYDLMAKAFFSLLEQGEMGREAFRRLLNDKSPHVRCWVAAQLLYEGDAEAKEVLNSLRHVTGLVGFNADMTLREYATGRLDSPFDKHHA